MDLESLADEARGAAASAYAPYSNFRVGSVAVAADGRHFNGVNVENASYSSTLCAEATAIANAVTAGVTSIDMVAVACLDADSLDDAYPCGTCRQQMYEFGVKRVVVATASGDVRVHDLEELLPYGFTLRH